MPTAHATSGPLSMNWRNNHATRQHHHDAPRPLMNQSNSQGLHELVIVEAVPLLLKLVERCSLSSCRRRGVAAEFRRYDIGGDNIFGSAMVVTFLGDLRQSFPLLFV